MMIGYLACVIDVVAGERIDRSAYGHRAAAVMLRFPDQVSLLFVNHSVSRKSYFIHPEESGLPARRVVKREYRSW
jgi:hypothetical protein